MTTQQPDPDEDPREFVRRMFGSTSEQKPNDAGEFVRQLFGTATEQDEAEQDDARVRPNIVRGEGANTPPSRHPDDYLRQYVRELFDHPDAYTSPLI